MKNKIVTLIVNFLNNHRKTLISLGVEEQKFDLSTGIYVPADDEWHKHNINISFYLKRNKRIQSKVELKQHIDGKSTSEKKL